MVALFLIAVAVIFQLWIRSSAFRAKKDAARASGHDTYILESAERSMAIASYVAAGLAVIVGIGDLLGR